MVSSNTHTVVASDPWLTPQEWVLSEAGLWTPSVLTGDKLPQNRSADIVWTLVMANKVRAASSYVLYECGEEF